GDLAILFRDRDLSDAVGFTYSRNEPTEAVSDFCGRLKAIAQRAPGPRPVVPVILDGENPWEHYPDGGEGFLRGLYTALTSDGSEEHTSELQSHLNLVCRLLLEKKNE